MKQLMARVWLLCLALTCCCSAATDVDVVVVLFTRKKHIYGLERLLPAFEIARETISHRVERGEYANFTLRWVFTPDNCTLNGPVNNAIREAAKLYFEGKSLAYFGLSSSHTLSSVADFAASVNVPIFSGSAGTVELYNKDRYPTATQTIYDSNTMVSFLRELFLLNGWDSYVLLRKGYIARLIKDAIENGLREADVTGFTIFVEDNDESYRESLERASVISRSEYELWCRV